MASEHAIGIQKRRSKNKLDLAGMAPLVGVLSSTLKGHRSIPSQGKHPGCGFGPG